LRHKFSGFWAADDGLFLKQAMSVPNLHRQRRTHQGCSGVNTVNALPSFKSFAFLFIATPIPFPERHLTTTRIEGALTEL
jgi:hypothetical protein